MDTREVLKSVDEAWPCQRLRIGWALVLFFLFEVTLGRQLPEVMPYLALGLGLALLGSALYAIRVLRYALEHRPG